MAQNRVSDEPIYWGLFGFGGMVIGFAMPILLVLLILQGFGCDLFIKGFFGVISHFITAGILFVIISATLWHCFHRIYHGLHDLTIHTTRLHHYVLYGAAFTLSIIALIECFGMWYGLKFFLNYNF
ncbi:MAG: fumarate reductase subunit FrdD [Succinivibrionaceae bacterium]